MKTKAKTSCSTAAMGPVETSHEPPTEAQIRQRAHEIFLARGATHGQDLEDWLRAERELQTSQNSPDHPLVRDAGNRTSIVRKSR